MTLQHSVKHRSQDSCSAAQLVALEHCILSSAGCAPAVKWLAHIYAHSGIGIEEKGVELELALYCAHACTCALLCHVILNFDLKVGLSMFTYQRKMLSGVARSIWKQQAGLARVSSAARWRTNSCMCIVYILER